MPTTNPSSAAIGGAVLGPTAKTGVNPPSAAAKSPSGGGASGAAQQKPLDPTKPPSIPPITGDMIGPMVITGLLGGNPMSVPLRAWQQQQQAYTQAATIRGAHFDKYIGQLAQEGDVDGLVPHKREIEARHGPSGWELILSRAAAARDMKVPIEKLGVLASRFMQSTGALEPEPEAPSYLQEREVVEQFPEIEAPRETADAVNLKIAEDYQDRSVRWQNKMAAKTRRLIDRSSITTKGRFIESITWGKKRKLSEAVEEKEAQMWLEMPKGVREDLFKMEELGVTLKRETNKETGMSWYESRTKRGRLVEKSEEFQTDLTAKEKQEQAAKEATSEAERTYEAEMVRVKEKLQVWGYKGDSLKKKLPTKAQWDRLTADWESSEDRFGQARLNPITGIIMGSTGSARTQTLNWLKEVENYAKSGLFEPIEIIGKTIKVLNSIGIKRASVDKIVAAIEDFLDRLERGEVEEGVDITKEEVEGSK